MAGTDRVSVFGASGFLGSHLAARLEARSIPFECVDRPSPAGARPLGHLIYAIGITGDFRSRPLDTAEAHVGALIDVLRGADFTSLLYLSSTRLYGTAELPTSPDDPYQLPPVDSRDVYNLSKALGEAVLLASGRPVRVARLSNVYGPGDRSDNFLASVVKHAVNGAVRLETDAASERDYIHVDDAVDRLIDIARAGRSRIYNVATGVNVTAGAILARLVDLTNCRVDVAPAAPVVRQRPVDVGGLAAEFGPCPARVLESLPDLVAAARRGSV